MVWGIIGAMKMEVTLILEQMELKDTKEILGCTYYTGTLEKQRIVLVECGIGKINAATCAYTMVQVFGVERLINIGIAGALAPGMRLLDTVIGSELLFHDINAVVYQKYYPYKTVFASDTTMVEAMQQTLGQLGQEYAVGRITTGDEFVQNTALKHQIYEQTQALCVEMEGAAIAQVAFMSGTPFVVLRTLSDSADDTAKQTYDNIAEQAAHKSAALIRQFFAAQE